jgi:mannan endo-1,4-beta-mannosidase
LKNPRSLGGGFFPNFYAFSYKINYSILNLLFMKKSSQTLVNLTFMYWLLTIALCQAQNTVLQNFITTSGSQLMDGKEPYRFVSFNIPTLNFQEDEMAFYQKQAFVLPTQYEIKDVLESVKQMGGKVVRIYTIPVRDKTDLPETPRYVLAPGKFDERAFQTLDTMMAVANEVGVRIIFPLLNNWQWMGGRPQYADFRGKTQEDFWVDKQLIEDFKKTVEFVINRKNTVTGTLYKDDKAIMCWETGNELTCPHEWTVQITRYIKKLDKNHLVMDGYFATGDKLVRKEAVEEASIDILSSHHYETTASEMIQNIEGNLKIVQGKKPYVLGEFGFWGTPGIERILDYLMPIKQIAGALIWGLRSHRQTGGFYWHSEPLGYGIYKAYHYPGFTSGDEYDEKNLLNVIIQNAYKIQGKEIPAIEIPKAPALIPFEDVSQISWRGSVSASSYDVERSADGNSSWQVVGFDISDAEEQYFPLFHDKTAEIGQTYFYRVIAKNQAGKSQPSNVVKTTVKQQALIDGMKTYGQIYFVKGKVSFETADDRKYKEDMFRLQGEEGTEITYYVAGKITGWKIYTYNPKDTESLEFETSADDKIFQKASSHRESYFGGADNYGYWYPILYHAHTPMDAQFLRIKFKTTTQIARIEVFYK